MTLTGSGSSTNPQDVHWFCHICGWAGMLKVGEHHACAPQISDRRALRALPRTRLPGLWRLSGWARRGLDADTLCPRCYDRWSEGIWFWRWCRKCPSSGRAEFLAAHLGDLHPCDEPKGWQEFEITLSFYVTSDDPDVIERERQRIWAGLPDAALEVADA